MKSYGRTIAEFLELPVPPFEGLSVATVEDTEFLDWISREREFSREELALIRFHVLHNQRIYIPGRTNQVAYLATPSHNWAAELAAIHLLHAHMRPRALRLGCRTRADFFGRVLEGAFGFFGSLILNPRRKCDLSQDHLRRLRELGGFGDTRREPPLFPFEAEARELCLSVLPGSHAHRPEDAQLIESFLRRPRLGPAMLLGARFAGQILGKRLHHAVLESGAFSVEDVRRIFFHRRAPHDPEARYEELCRLLSHPKLKAPRLRSKRESL
jgi:hypothetical protein